MFICSDSTDPLLAQRVRGRFWDAYELHQPAPAGPTAGVWCPGRKPQTKDKGNKRTTQVVLL